MQSASVFPAVSDREAMECVVCALECQEYDQLMHWVASGSVSHCQLLVINIRKSKVLYTEFL